MSIVVDVEDGLKFACIDSSSQQQKRRKALCIQTDLFLSCPKSKGSCPNTGIVWMGASEGRSDGRDQYDRSPGVLQALSTLHCLINVPVLFNIPWD